MVFSSFLQLPSGSRQKFQLGDKLQRTEHTCREEPFLGVAWAVQPAEKGNCIFVVSKVGFRNSSSLLGPSWLHLSVAFYKKGFHLLYDRSWAMYMMWNSLGKSVFNASTRGADKVHLLLQSASMTVNMKYGYRYFTKQFSVIFSLRCCNFKHCELGVDRGTQ